MTFKDILDVISTGGTLAICGLIIAGFMTGWLRTRAEVEDKEEDIDYERAQKQAALDLATSLAGSRSDDRIQEALETIRKLDQQRKGQSP